MGARILDGAAISRAIRAELKPRVERFTARSGRPPGLGIVLVGDNPASEIYVRNKVKAAGEAGIRTDLLRLPASASLPEVLARIRDLNVSPEYDGILVQSPLPESMGASADEAVSDAVAPGKDVDGFHPLNVGRLVQNRPCLTPCTPTGVIALLDRSDIQIAGSHAVVIGRSGIVGKPMALLLLHRNATVTVCHSRTRDLAREASRADLLVAAIGRAGFVRPDFVKPGATVIDVGINRITDSHQARELLAGAAGRMADFERRGEAVVGDVHPTVSQVAGALTPVPGGVGPLTIAMLLANTIKAAELAGSESS